MRRIASLIGVSLIAGGLTALLLFASSARAQTKVNLPLVGQLGGGDAQVQEETTTSTTTGGSGSGASTTSTTTGGSGSGASTTTSTTAASTSSTSSTAVPTTNASAACTGGPSLTIAVQAIRPGDQTQVSGVCFPKDMEVGLTLFSDPISLGSVRTDTNGAFSANVTIPQTVPEGTHTLSAAGGGTTAAATLIVSNTALGRTGRQSWNLAVFGVALIAAGIIMLAGQRIAEQELQS